MQKVKKNEIKFATEDQVNQLKIAAKKTRNPIRNELIIMMLYQHGFRVSELCSLNIDAINLKETRIYIKRMKNSNDFIHPIPGQELRLIKRYLREREKNGHQKLPWCFISEQGGQIHRDTINKLLIECSSRAKLPRITPHMLRHGCGYSLINKRYDIRVIQDYLGHKDIKNTMKYTQLDANQFLGLWD